MDSAPTSPPLIANAYPITNSVIIRKNKIKSGIFVREKDKIAIHTAGPTIVSGTPVSLLLSLIHISEPTRPY